jgi:SWI/SNF-related matrix-associated actin-dependent regulator of chromatin subfamily D
MDLLSFERKLDSTIMRKRLDIQEALKRPMKQKRKLRIFISNTAFPAKGANEGAVAAGPGAVPAVEGAADAAGGEATTASWELRVEGRLIDEDKRVSNVSPGLGVDLILHLLFQARPCQDEAQVLLLLQISGD